MKHMKDMKRMKCEHNRILRLLSLLLALSLTAALVGCGAAGGGLEGDAPSNGFWNGMYNSADLYFNSEKGESGNVSDSERLENPFFDTTKQNVSTFSADVDTASYALFRKTVNGLVSQKANTQTILSSLEKNAAAWRTEEFLNYFRYDATAPSGEDLFGVTSGIVSCPWNSENLLLRLTLQAAATTPTDGNNLVFLIDVSGSMSGDDKLGLLKTAFSYLTEQLTEQDVVTIVTYSGSEQVVLQGCSGADKQTILAAVNGLEARGYTNGEAGLKKAYQLAADYYIAGGNNRIIMASDGDLNVGISSADELKAFVESKRDEGIFLSVLGFGSGNYRDRNMEALADNGNGVYYYIDGESEAQKVFGTDLISTLYTVAKDVKLQLTFDPTYIAAYRLIGYENRQLANEDFTDDTKDAGEVGAGHQVTVFYELVPTDFESTENANGSAEWISLAVRYKQPDADVSEENVYSIGAADCKQTDADTAFMLCVVQLAMLLRGDSYLPEEVSFATIYETLNGLDLSAHTDRGEFKELVSHLLA